MSTAGSGLRSTIPPTQRADAVISQANPVSTTLYEVLATTKNVRLIAIATNITWAVTQPTPLEVVITIDGITLVYGKANPVSTSDYEPFMRSDMPEANNQLTDKNTYLPFRPFMLEGKTVRVQVRVTWAVTQPTPLVCRVKYAKW